MSAGDEGRRLKGDQMTLRQLLDKVGPEWIDAELGLIIHDANGRSAYVVGDRFSDWPTRREADPRTGEPAWINIMGTDRTVRILPAKK